MALFRVPGRREFELDPHAILRVHTFSLSEWLKNSRQPLSTDTDILPRIILTVNLSTASYLGVFPNVELWFYTGEGGGGHGSGTTDRGLRDFGATYSTFCQDQ